MRVGVGDVCFKLGCCDIKSLDSFEIINTKFYLTTKNNTSFSKVDNFLHKRNYRTEMQIK